MGRLTIGIMLNQLEGRYQQLFWQGASAGAREAGVDLVYFLGGEPGRPGESPLKSAAYRLADSAVVDGLVVAAHALKTKGGDSALARAVSFFPKVPSIFISQPFEDGASFLAENEGGIAAMVDHLAARHGRRRFLFVRGEESHLDGAARSDAFRAAMERLGSAVERWEMIPGDFSWRSGHDAVFASFSREGEAPFDAVVCANDEMAFGALEALEALGIAVPERVSVTGFDDVIEAALATPPLTTVQQPVCEMTRDAVIGLSRLLREGTPVASKTFPSRAVFRESCGCLPSYINGPRTEPLTQLCLRLGCGDGEARDIEETFLRFVRDLAQRRPVRDEMLSFFQTRLLSALRRGSDLSLWRSGITSLRRLYLDSVGSEGTFDSGALLVFNELNDLVGEYALISLQRSFTAVHHKVYRLKEALERLTDSTSVDDLVRGLAEWVPQFQLKELYLLLYPEPQATGESFAAPPGRVRLFLRVTDGHPWIPGDPIEFDPREILPREEWNRSERRQFFLSPLISLDVTYGYLLTEIHDREGRVSDDLYVQTLQSLIGGALRNVYSHEEKSRAKESLAEALRRVEELSVHDELTGLLNRRGFNSLAERDLEVARRNGTGFVMLFADMDGLKGINDRFGHEAGDRAIRLIARALRESLRETDIVARLGGDEFVAMVADEDAEMAAGTAARLRERIAGVLDSLSIREGLPFPVSASLGILYAGEEEMKLPLEELLKKADGLLYAEKAARKGTAFKVRQEPDSGMSLGKG